MGILTADGAAELRDAGWGGLLGRISLMGGYHKSNRQFSAITQDGSRRGGVLNPKLGLYNLCVHYIHIEQSFCIVVMCHFSSRVSVW